MGGAGGEVNEERLVGRDGFLAMDPGDRVVGDVFGEVIALFRLFPRLDRRLVAEDLPLPAMAGVFRYPPKAVILRALAARSNATRQ
ncbi:hypothetical protein QM467_07145 [Rhodoblastus sp. 17X3]|uniref:hypothetical protein n=1 Tax=Rhodoblastus sp. 17X3 TaxID=3047026 RepID=UPI0024B7547B|nr:hypothetical protein [Rhodoblastus sp. 17X3]MDI9847827.1 hypothetical protein [Rhodoblastus sp. 17X3]